MANAILGEYTMDGAFGTRSTRTGPTINVTPLIDVMFLLLIFFMVSTTFREYVGIDLTLPKALTGVEQDRENYEITVTESGGIHFDENTVTPEELHSALITLFKEDPKASLVLRADKEAAFQNIITVMDITRDVGGTHLIIPTQPLIEEGIKN